MKNNKAFTIIELLIVIAVIGILAIVAFPQYQESKLKARRAECFNTLPKMINETRSFYIKTYHYPCSTAYKGVYTGSATCGGSDWILKFPLKTSGAGATVDDFYYTYTVKPGAVNIDFDGWFPLTSADNKINKTLNTANVISSTYDYTASYSGADAVASCYGSIDEDSVATDQMDEYSLLLGGQMLQMTDELSDTALGTAISPRIVE